MSDPGKPLGFAFKTSSHSDGGGCVEVALSLDGNVIVRDSKDPARSIRLTFSAADWKEFLRGIKDGEFDLQV